MFTNLKDKPFMKKSEKQLAEEILQEAVTLNEKYQKKMKTDKIMPRDYYRKNSDLSKQSEKIFGAYSQIKKKIIEVIEKDSPKIIRDDLNININIAKKYQKNKKYVVTAAIAGASLNKPFFNAIKTYCEYNNAQLVILPMRGLRPKEDYFADEILEHSDKIATSFKFNDSLKAYDLKLNPQQRNPLTGLDAIGHKKTSIIIASPKMHMKIVPTGTYSIPHMIHSTGTISDVDYRDSRWGVIANNDHTYAALCVEVESNDKFHVRQLESQKDGSFTDLNKHYLPDGKVLENKAVSIYLGDTHAGWVDKDAKKAAFEQIKLNKPEYIFQGDVFDGSSISHHTENDRYARFNLPDHLKTLELELNTYAKEIMSWLTEFKDKKHRMIMGNHEEALTRYLKEGRFIKDNVENSYIAATLYQKLLEGKNPLEWWCRENYPAINKYDIQWLKREDEIRLEGILHSVHGDKGANGSRGSAISMERSYAFSNTGHTHTPAIFRGAWIAGTLTKFNLPYTKGSPSSWTHSNIITHTGGKRQILTEVGGTWKI